MTIGQPWCGEEMVLHSLRAHSDSVSLALHPCGGGLGGGSRAGPGTLSHPGTSRVSPPPTLFLPHKGGGDQTGGRHERAASQKRNKNKKRGR